MDASNPAASTAQGYLGGTAAWRTDLDAIVGGQEQYAQALIGELRTARVEPRDVWAQSFNLADVLGARLGRAANG